MHINITPHFGSTFQRTHATFPTVKGKSGRSPRPREYSEHWLVGWDEDEVADGEGIKNPQLSLAIKIITPIDCSKVTKATAIKHFRCFGFFFFFFFINHNINTQQWKGRKRVYVYAFPFQCKHFFILSYLFIGTTHTPQEAFFAFHFVIIDERKYIKRHF